MAVFDGDKLMGSLLWLQLVDGKPLELGWYRGGAGGLVVDGGRLTASIGGSVGDKDKCRVRGELKQQRCVKGECRRLS